MKHLKNILLLLCLTQIDACNVNAERVRSVEHVELCIKEDSKKQTNVTDVIGKINDIEVEESNLEYYINKPYDKLLQLVQKIYPDGQKDKYALMIYLMTSTQRLKKKFTLELSELSEAELQEKLDALEGWEKEEYAMIRYIYEEREEIRKVAPEYADYVEGYGNYKHKYNNYHSDLFEKAMYMIEDYKQYYKECLTFQGTTEEYAREKAAKVFEHHLMNFKHDLFFSNLLNKGLMFIDNSDKRAELNSRLCSLPKEIKIYSSSEMNKQLAAKKLMLDAMGQSATEKLEFLLNTCVRSEKFEQFTREDCYSGVISGIHSTIRSVILHFPQIHAFRRGQDSSYIVREGETSLSAETILCRVAQQMRTEKQAIYIQNPDGSCEVEYKDLSDGIAVASEITDAALRGREELNLEEIEEFCKEVSSEAQAYIDGKRASKLIPYETSALNSSATKKRIEESVKNSSFDKISYVGYLYEEVDKMMKTTDSDEERKEKLAEAYVYFLMLEEISEGNEKDIEYVAKIENANDEVLEKVTQTLKSQYNNSYSS